MHDGTTMGPFARQRALDLAEGMVTALRQHGETVELIVEGKPAPTDLVAHSESD